MSTDYQTAINDMNTLFRTAWNANAAAIAGGYVPTVLWQGIEPSDTLDQSKFFARVSHKMVAEGIGGPGKRVYESAGLMYVQLFAPMSGGAAMWAKLRQLSDVALYSIRGKKTPNGVWFRNERRNELTPDGKFQRINVVAEFQFVQVVN